MLGKYKVFLFDCDGVIFDTNKAKTNAFIETLYGYDKNIIDKFICYHQKNGGVSRYEKFKYLFVDILKKPVDIEEYNLLLNKYSVLSKRIYDKCEFTTDALKILKTLKDKGKKTYVVSGSDQSELRNAFIRRKIKDLFIEIYGSPKNKIELVRSIKEKNQSDLNVMIGDSYTDWEAAKHNEVDFIFMSRYSEMSQGVKRKLKSNSIFSIETLFDLNRELIV